MGQAKRRGSLEDRIRQAKAQGQDTIEIVANSKEVEPWMSALQTYMTWCSMGYWQQHNYLYEHGTGIKIDDFVIQFRSDATGFDDKDKAVLVKYTGGTVGSFNDLIGKMIWQMDLDVLTKAPVLLEWVDSTGKTKSERLGIKEPA